MYLPPGSEVQGSYTKRKRKGAERYWLPCSSLGRGRRGIGITKVEGRGKKAQEGWED